MSNMSDTPRPLTHEQAKLETTSRDTKYAVNSLQLTSRTTPAKSSPAEARMPTVETLIKLSS